MALANQWRAALAEGRRLARRTVEHPPRLLARRLWRELRAALDLTRMRPAPAIWRSEPRRLFGGDLCALWTQLAARPYATRLFQPDAARDCGDLLNRSAILAAADRALARRVDLLGESDWRLERPINWRRDPRSGHQWPMHYAHRLCYTAPGADVKLVWELSRLGWLLPAGQAYVLTGDERYAEGVRAVLEDWMGGNPPGWGVNWACTMEVALRMLSWTWLFHALHASQAWEAPSFRRQFLASLYEHGRYTLRNLEESDVNGNHFTANAAGLVFAGLFFGELGEAPRWQRCGWEILEQELPRQVGDDGVDFEASTAYHRLVLELFLLPALYREAQELPVGQAYRDRLAAMARFTLAYTRPDGNAPLWGDADDGRALPLGRQPLGDHRYLAGLVGAAWEIEDLQAGFSGPRDEVCWVLGPAAARRLPELSEHTVVGSRAFAHSGAYVLSGQRDHVFVDCGGVGLAGRGGHGHNDCLSFEAALEGRTLVSDCGTLVYTRSPHERDRFRSTAAHNTPRVAGEEINRFAGLWGLCDDARGCVRHFSCSHERDVLEASHDGYRRLCPAVTPVRRFVLDHELHVLAVLDRFETTPGATLELEIPLQLAIGVEPVQVAAREWLLESGESFRLLCDAGPRWQFALEPGQVSPSYGVAQPAWRIVARYHGPADTSLAMVLGPGRLSADELMAAARASGGVPRDGDRRVRKLACSESMA